MERDGLGPGEVLLVAAAGLVLVLAATLWCGAAVAAALFGGPWRGTLADAARAVVALPANLGRPALAWPAEARPGLPGPVAYWACTAAVGVGSASVLGIGLRLLTRSRVGTEKRRPLGVEGWARWATRRDLTPLLVRRPESGRLVIARFGSALVATEDAARSTRRRARQGDRGAVALIGPSRSGKTTAIVSGIRGSARDPLGTTRVLRARPARADVPRQRPQHRQRGLASTEATGSARRLEDPAGLPRPVAWVARMSALALVEADDRWLLPLAGRSIERVCIEFAVTLVITGGLQLRIEQPFVIEGADGSEALLVPEGDPDRLAAAVTLARREVNKAEGFKDGHLEIGFADGGHLAVPADEGFEAWELVGPGGLRTVSLPGGDFAVWRADGDGGSG